MASARASRSPRWAPDVGLLVVIVLFCAPLFVGLSGWDLDNDEAIYSYAVQRVLETGDWLTPRSIPRDNPFLEKPPLKFWMVAAAIWTGLLPHNEFGLRFIDALLGSIAFVYVFLLGRRLAGSIAGVVAVLVLFTVDPLIFEHGLRSNTMDAALVLAFCGGMYHFARWVEGSSIERRRTDALAVAGYFVLGFMTKFVAVLFLPLVCAVAVAWRCRGLPHGRSGWRDWKVPLVLGVGATAPWFPYQAIHSGRDLWDTMVAAHLVDRFTVGVDPRHLQPWDFYYSEIWREATRAGSHWIVASGAAFLLWRAWRRDAWLPKLLFVWWMLPIAALSLGVSKVFHYSYPFLPPLALGAGAVVQALFPAVQRRASTYVDVAGRAVRRRVERSTHGVKLVVVAAVRTPEAHLAAMRQRQPWIRPIVVGAALLALVVAVWTAVSGSVQWNVSQVRVFRNSSVVRPLVIGVILLYLSGSLRAAKLRLVSSAAIAVAILAVLLPLAAYSEKLERATGVRHPLRTLRDCVVSLRSSHAPETHVYVPYPDLLTHSYFYYLRTVGPWLEHEPSSAGAPAVPSDHRLALLRHVDYLSLARQKSMPLAVALTRSEPVVVAAMGDLEPCAVAAVAAGGAAIRPSSRLGS